MGRRMAEYMGLGMWDGNMGMEGDIVLLWDLLLWDHLRDHRSWYLGVGITVDKIDGHQVRESNRMQSFQCLIFVPSNAIHYHGRHLHTRSASSPCYMRGSSGRK